MRKSAPSSRDRQNCMFPELYLASQCGATRNLLVEPGNATDRRGHRQPQTKTALRWQKQQKDLRRKSGMILLIGQRRLVGAGCGGIKPGRAVVVTVTECTAAHWSNSKPETL